MQLTILFIDENQYVKKCTQSYVNIYIGLFEEKLIFSFVLETMNFTYELWTIFPNLKYTTEVGSLDTHARSTG